MKHNVKDTYMDGYWDNMDKIMGREAYLKFVIEKVHNGMITDNILSGVGDGFKVVGLDEIEVI
jgi:hypothetical protein